MLLQCRWTTPSLSRDSWRSAGEFNKFPHLLSVAEMAEHLGAPVDVLWRDMRSPGVKGVILQPRASCTIRSTSSESNCRTGSGVPAGNMKFSCEGIRFSSKGFAAIRARLGLSAAQMGFLMGASDQSIYKWERGDRPRAHQLPKIAALRKMNAQQFASILEFFSKLAWLAAYGEPLRGGFHAC